MSEEQKECKCKVLVGLVILSLVFSMASLILSTLMATGNISVQNKKVVISKQYDKGKTLGKALATEKPVIAFFYTDWCGYCQKFAPTFNKITKDARIKKNYAVAYINCEQELNKNYISDYGITGFPTVFVIEPNGKRTQLDSNTFFYEDTKEILISRLLDIAAEIKKDEPANEAADGANNETKAE